MAPPLQAQQQDSLSIDLEPIEVTALRSTVSATDAPLSLSITSRNVESINASSSLSLKSIGDGLPGLWINDRQNYALGEQMTIRGLGWRAAFGVRGIQVVLNGLPLTIADGQSITNIIDPAFIRRAELVRGPAATYWGNSSGGVLYLSTDPNYSKGTHTRLRTMAGSYGLGKGEAEFSITSDKHNINVYSSYLATDGFRDYSSANLWRSGLTGSLQLTDRSRIQYSAASIYMPEAQHPSSLGAEDASNNPTKARDYFVNAGSGKQITQGQAGLSYILDTSAGVLNITGYGTYRDLNNPLPFGIITVNRWAGGLRATLDKSFNRFHLQGGAEMKIQHDDRIEFENIGENRQPVRGQATVNQLEQVWNQALFVNGTYEVGDLNFTAGLRYDRLRFSTDSLSTRRTSSRAFQSVSPSIGLSYSPGPYTLFTNLSTSFQAPTTTELVNRPSGGNGFNPNLQPEKTVGIETGIRSQSAQQFTYDITAFHLWIYDLLFPYQLQADGPTYYRNQGETAHTGLEGSLSYRFNPDWQVSTTANLTRATFRKAQTLDSTSLSGKDVPGIPNFRFHSKLSWSPQNLITSISYEFADSYAVNNLNQNKNDSYGVLDFELSYRYSFTGSSTSLQPFVNINNLLDVRYNGSVAINNQGGRYYEPAPGRNWQAGIAVTF
ncbi:TonB-dependent receptor family protein [Fodinibius salsisoli]|uniref:TonB-dependent receptor n=1 Tax=Fodinibius salsisoli TaxID=2820877 RepID=A0ABT3PR62_9BACT|nr:TonB-dependent receptor [Fodinibius salsisoli]